MQNQVSASLHQARRLDAYGPCYRLCVSRYHLGLLVRVRVRVRVRAMARIRVRVRVRVIGLGLGFVSRFHHGLRRASTWLGLR